MSSNLMMSFFEDLEALAAKYRGLVAPQAQAVTVETAAPVVETQEQPAEQPATQTVEWTHEKLMTWAKTVVDKHGGVTNPLIVALHMVGYKKVSETPVERLGELAAEIKRQYGEG